MAKAKLKDSTAELEELVAAKEAKRAQLAVVEEDEILAENEADLTSEFYKALQEQGMTEGEIRQAKENFGHVFAFPFADKVYLFRALKRREWKLIRQAADSEEEFQVLLIKHGCIFPALDADSLDGELAGIQDMLSMLIQRASGFLIPEEALAVVREM
jgi:uncharacterized protein (DUF3084 family)